MPQPVKRKKLYFDCSLPAGVTRRIFPVTLGRASFNTGDMYGGLLDNGVPKVTTASPVDAKRRNMVHAWFEPQTFLNVGVTTVARVNTGVLVDFVVWTCAGKGITAAGIGFTGASGTQLPGGASSGTNPAILTGSAASALLTKNFAVRVRKLTDDSLGVHMTVRGTLYVERQHSIEV